VDIGEIVRGHRDGSATTPSWLDVRSGPSHKKEAQAITAPTTATWALEQLFGWFRCWQRHPVMMRSPGTILLPVIGVWLLPPEDQPTG
jgi:hypothetical protein